MNAAHSKARCNAASAAIRMAVLVRIECSGSDAWIGGQQHEVGDQVTSHHEESGEHDAANHKVEVAGARGFEDELAEAGNTWRNNTRARQIPKLWAACTNGVPKTSRTLARTWRTMMALSTNTRMVTGRSMRVARSPFGPTC